MPTDTTSTARLDVRKTYKLYVGGKFPRSESGRSYEVTDSRARFLANAGAAILLPQGELSPQRVALIADMSREQLLQMAEKAHALAKPDATAAVAQACMALGRGNQGVRT